MDNRLLMHFRDSEAEVVKRLDEYARRSSQSGRLVLTAFLTPRELEIAGMMAARHHVELRFFGGYPGAERVRAMFLPLPDEVWGGTDDRFEIECLMVTSAHGGSLRHQDYLGALMGLGIQRNQFGDIVVSKEPGVAYLFSVHSMASYIVDHYTQAGKVPMIVERRAQLPDLQNLGISLEERVFTLKSLRLDALVANAFGFSRTHAVTPIKAGKVQLNYSICDDVTAEVAVGDVISLRGEGRIRVLSVKDNAKSGRKFVQIGKYT